MSTFDRILKAQQEQREKQSLRDKQIVDSMFSNTNRSLNNNYLLKKEEN